MWATWSVHAQLSYRQKSPSTFPFVKLYCSTPSIAFYPIIHVLHSHYPTAPYAFITSYFPLPMLFMLFESATLFPMLFMLFESAPPLHKERPCMGTPDSTINHMNTT